MAKKGSKRRVRKNSRFAYQRELSRLTDDKENYARRIKLYYQKIDRRNENKKKALSKLKTVTCKLTVLPDDCVYIKKATSAVSFKKKSRAKKLTNSNLAAVKLEHL